MLSVSWKKQRRTGRLRDDMHERRSEPRKTVDIIIHHSDPPVTGVDYNFVRLTSGQKFIRALEAQGIRECWIFQQCGMTYIAWVVPEG